MTDSIWYQKHAPTSLSGFAGNDDKIAMIRSYISSGQLPNLIVTGHGKTLFSKLVVQEYLDTPALQKYGWLQIQGSIYRSKSVVSDSAQDSSDNIIDFVKRSIRLRSDRHRIVSIYDFDSMTTEAQNAIRSPMENWSHRSRFILIVDNLSGVIEPIQSRTIIINLNPLNHETTVGILSRVPELTVNPEIINLIATVSYGNLKTAFNYLQACSTQSPDMTPDQFYRIFGVPPVDQVSCLVDDPTLTDIISIVGDFIEHGYTLYEVLDVMIAVLSKTYTITQRDLLIKIPQMLSDRVRTHMDMTEHSLLGLYDLFDLSEVNLNTP